MRWLTVMLREAYKQTRGHELDSDLPTYVLAEFALVKMRDLVRGSIYRQTYRTCSGLHFRGGNSVVRNGRYFRIGANVALGDHVAIDAYSKSGVVLGDRVTVGSFSNLLGSAVVREQGEGISIGSNTAIGRQNVIWGQGGVVIGDDCLLGPGVTIISENHGYINAETPIRSQPGTRARVEIGDDCWIGAGATVLAGVKIGSGSIIGAGAVVTSNVPAGSIAVGVPAKVLRLRPGFPHVRTDDAYQIEEAKIGEATL